MPNLLEMLQLTLHGRVCFMGLGNADYGDDGFGVRLADSLVDAGVPDVIVAGASPDRYIGSVAEQGYEHLVFLDAVESGSAPGSVVFLNSGEMAARFPQFSTHKISLGILAQWAEAGGTTKAWLLGVQPESIKPGQALTPVMQTTLETLRELLCNFASNGEVHA